MTDPNDALSTHDRVFLENLNLAVGMMLRLGEDSGVLNNVLESELFLFRDRVEHALLSQAAPGRVPEPGL